MHIKSVNEMSDYVDIDSKAENTDWKLWCRLCAKEDKVGNINVFFKDEQSATSATTATLTNWIGNTANTDLSLSAAIGKYFWVNITRDEDLPKMLCTECFSLVTALVNFSERVSKVQQMFVGLLNSSNMERLDLRAMRQKYGLLDEDREHVLINQRLPEVHYFDAKPKLFECAEAELIRNDDECINPLESTAQSRHIKMEVPLADNEEELEIGEEELTDHEKFRNDAVPDEHISNEFDMLEESSNAINESSPAKSKSNSASPQHVMVAQSKPLGRTRTTRKQIIERNMVENMELTGDSESFTCSECPRKFKREQDIKVHLARKHGKKYANSDTYQCPQCPRVFNRRSNLERHANVHLPLASRKVLPCPYCDKKFLSNTLQSHVSYKHMNQQQRLFICEECGITLRTNASLKEHMLTHTDYAPFECRVCKKGFKSHTRLKLHMEIHDPNKHICAKCGLQLNSRATLNRHLLVHSDVMQHKCDYCGRAFKRAKALKNHLILHTGLKPYSCDFCDRTFANGSNCRTHKKKAHPEELAALEAAGGGKSYTKNIPKLEALKAVTKTADNLAPVVSKQSGRFAFGKKPKLDENKISDKSVQSLNVENANNILEVSSTQKQETVARTIPTIDNIYAHITKHASQEFMDDSGITKDKLQAKLKECGIGGNAEATVLCSESTQQRLSLPESFVMPQQTELQNDHTSSLNNSMSTSTECAASQTSRHDEPSNSSSVNFFDNITHNLQQQSQHALAPYI